MKTKKFRKIVVASVVYSVLILLLLGENTYWDMDDMVTPFFIFTAPVWIFWSAVWVNPERFDSFFRSDSGENIKSRQWVYVDKETAKTHKYYGIGGWALFLAFSYVASFIVGVYIFITFADFLDDLLKIVMALGLTIHIVVFYSLVTHQEYFQKLFIFTFVISILLYIGTTIYLNKLDPRGIADAVRGLIWMVYIVRSKRINITIRHRLRMGEEYLLANGNVDKKDTHRKVTITDNEELNYELLKAVMNGDEKSIRSLLNSGADPNAKNSMGYSAIDYARGHGYSRIERILETF